MEEKRSELILESLDSVWFFSNIFSPPSTTELVHNHDYPNKAQEEDEDEEEEAPKPISPLPTKNQQVESSSSPPSDHVVLPIKKKTKSRRRKRRKRCNRKILGELELEFNGCDLWEFGGGDDDDDDDDDQVVKNSKEEECGCGLMFGRSQLGEENYQMKDQKMPPLHDGLAMKEHLKSWAYAVACTVR